MGLSVSTVTGCVATTDRNMGDARTRFSFAIDRASPSSNPPPG
ncbi:hypothetical protein ACFQY5_35495 [Paeniroseomonas aquatica]